MKIHGFRHFARLLDSRRLIIWVGVMAIAAIAVTELLTLLQGGFDHTPSRTIDGALFGVLMVVILILAHWFVAVSLGAFLALLFFGFGNAEQLILLVVSLIIFSVLAASVHSAVVRHLYLAVLAVWVIQFAFRAQDDAITLVVQIPAVAITYIAARSIFILREKNQLSAQQMTDLRERTESAIRNERKNIARDLHDIVAHDITIVAMQSKAAQYADNAHTTKEAIEIISKLSSETLHDLRLMLNVLRTDGTMSDIGVDPTDKPAATTIDALQGAKIFSERLQDAGFAVETKVADEISKLPRSAHTALYRVMQEATTNVLKHAKPRSRCSVALERVGDKAVLRMVNEVSEFVGVASRDALIGGSGLIGMEDRMNAFGGHFEAGRRGKQWVLVADIPF